MEVMGIGTTAQKMPELLANMEEMQKAVETVRRTTLLICEWLRIGVNQLIKEDCPPEPQPTLLKERVKYLGSLQQALYETNARLEEIMAVVREI